VLQLLPKSHTKAGFGDKSKQQHILALLLVCESLGGVTDEATARRLFSFGESFRTPIAIRRQALRVYGRIVEPSKQSVASFLKLLKRDDVHVNNAVYSATASFVGACRGKVAYVRRVYGDLISLRDKLSEAWRREAARSPESIDPPGLREIRDAVTEIDGLMVAYEEFSEMKKVGTS